MKAIIILGPAGSGKSLLSGALCYLLKDMGYDALILNLDPAALSYPYDAPDINIRSYVRTERVMRRFGLGPNGGLIASMDIAVKFARRIKREIMSMRPEILIVDTPGQLELFVFRQAGIALLREAIMGIGDVRAMAIFLFDPYLCDSPSSMLSLLLLASSTFLRIKIPMIGALTKIDLLEDKEKNQILEMINNPRLIMASGELGGILSAIRGINPRAIKLDVWPISSVTGQGLDGIVMKIEDLLGEE